MQPPKPKQPLEWDDLRVALAARRAGSFTGAAAALDVRQSTVSRRILALEAALGGALFTRARRGLLPTALGAAVCEEAERVEAAVRRALERAEELVNAPEGVARVAVAPGLAQHWLVPRLASLRERLPGLTFDLRVGTALADLTRDADLAIRFGDPGDGALIARKLGTLPMAVLGHPRWASRPPEAWAWAVLEGPDAPPRPTLAGAVAFTSNDYLAVLAAAQAGLGVMLGTRALLDLDLGLVALPHPGPLPPPMPLWLVARPEVRHLARVDALWRAVAGWAAELLDEASAAGP